MKLLTELDSLDNVKDGETRKLVTKATSSGSGNVVSSVSVSGDTITYTKDVTALTAHQNAFSKVKVGSTNIEADAAGDTLELVAGSNITLTPDATNDKVTIAATQPTVNNGTLTIQKNGTDVQTFTANQSENATANITVPTKISELTNDSNFITGMFIASYGSSTYAEVLDAYQKNKVIYCRASSNTNPATGNQLRMAFLAYVNNQTTPTEFEFQYYRSVSTHSESQQGDQVYVYKLNSSGTWSVTTREAYTKIATSTGLSNSYSNGTMTLTSDVSDIKINNTSVISNAVANIATEGTYNESTNKIATMSDVSSAVSGYVEKSSSSQNETGLTGWDYDSGLMYETRITDNNGDKYINITPSGNSVSVSNGTRNNYLEVGNQSLTLASINEDDDYPVNTTFTTNGGVTTLTTQGPDGIGSLDIYSNDTLSLTKANNDNSVSSTVSLRNDKITLYSDTVEVKQAPTTNLGVANKKYVDDAITALPEPMIFKGSLGTGGTITSLPTASSSNEGFTYKVITAGTYASQSAKVGDTFISDGSSWVLIPSGDEPSGTVTSITLSATSPIAIDSNAAITTSGSRTLSHANSGVTAGTYRSVTVNATGHVTAGTNPTTLSGYGITDAKIASGVITLGSNTITPLTSTQLTNQNLNDITTPGLYYAGGSNTTTNKPSNVDAYGLKVFKTASGYTTQELIEGNTTPEKRWTRQNSGSWSSWTEMKMTDTDTKNTAGSTDSSKKLFLVGAESQAANPQTYSQDTAYVGTDGHLYSNSVQVVNLSGSQALTNKTYNGYTLGAACAKAVVTSIDTSASLPTSNAVKTFVEGKGYTTNTGTITGIKMNGASKGTSGVVDLGTVSTTDTKNTAGSTDTSSKIFLIGATSQAANPQTYSDNEVYATSGVLTTKSVQVGGTAATMQYNSTDKCIEFIFA